MSEQRYAGYWAAGLYPVNLVANTSADGSWAGSPAPKPGADKVKYIGPGIGSAGGREPLRQWRMIPLRTRNVVDDTAS